jgi:hypothetical protein
LSENRRFHMKLCQGKKHALKSVTDPKWLRSYVIYL